MLDTTVVSGLLEDTKTYHYQSVSLYFDIIFKAKIIQVQIQFLF